MGECLILKAGAGIDTSNATANAEHILSGYTAYVNDMLVTGTMVNHGSVSNELSAGDSVELEKGYYELSTLTVKTLASQTEATAISSDILAPKTAWVNGAIITGNMVNRGAVTHGLPINGAYTIPSGFHNGSGKVTQSIATQGGWTITPRTSNVLACDAGRYTTGAIWVAGDGNLVSENIRKGVSIFGVGGSLIGYPSGPTDIYNRGYNPYGLHNIENFRFDSGQITKTAYSRGQLRTSSAVNLSGKTTMHIDFKFVGNNSSTIMLWRWDIQTLIGTSTYLNTMGTTTSFGFNANVTTNLHFYELRNKDGTLYFMGINSAIYRIWLS